MRKTHDDAAAIRIAFDFFSEKFATLHVAKPLVNRLSNDVMSSGERLCLKIASLNVGGMFPLGDVHFHDDIQAWAMPLMNTEVVPDPLDVYRRHTFTVSELKERYTNDKRVKQEDLCKLCAQLLTWHLPVYTYTFHKDYRFKWDVVIPPLIDAIVDFCVCDTGTRPCLNDISAAL